MRSPYITASDPTESAVSPNSIVNSGNRDLAMSSPNASQQIGQAQPRSMTSKHTPTSSMDVQLIPDPPPGSPSANMPSLSQAGEQDQRQAQHVASKPKLEQKEAHERKGNSSFVKEHQKLNVDIRHKEQMLDQTQRQGEVRVPVGAPVKTEDQLDLTNQPQQSFHRIAQEQPLRSHEDETPFLPSVQAQQGFLQYHKPPFNSVSPLVHPQMHSYSMPDTCHFLPSCQGFGFGSYDMPQGTNHTGVGATSSFKGPLSNAIQATEQSSVPDIYYGYEANSVYPGYQTPSLLPPTKKLRLEHIGSASFPVSSIGRYVDPQHGFQSELQPTDSCQPTTSHPETPDQHIHMQKSSNSAHGKEQTVPCGDICNESAYQVMLSKTLHTGQIAGTHSLCQQQYKNEQQREPQTSQGLYNQEQQHHQLGSKQLTSQQLGSQQLQHRREIEQTHQQVYFPHEVQELHSQQGRQLELQQSQRQQRVPQNAVTNVENRTNRPVYPPSSPLSSGSGNRAIISAARVLIGSSGAFAGGASYCRNMSNQEPQGTSSGTGLIAPSHASNFGPSSGPVLTARMKEESYVHTGTAKGSKTIDRGAFLISCAPDQAAKAHGKPLSHEAYQKRLEERAARNRESSRRAREKVKTRLRTMEEEIENLRDLVRTLRRRDEYMRAQCEQAVTLRQACEVCRLKPVATNVGEMPELMPEEDSYVRPLQRSSSPPQ